VASLLCGSQALQNAVAEGDTRTISLHHVHTDEDITITFKREGRYDEAALEKLNWFLRDWRKQQETKMDPHLIDLVWEAHRETGSKEPIWVICGYRSPETNAMLRRHSNGVARFSQHMLGHALDFYIPGVPLDKLRVIGLRLQRGGVGFYPTSGSPFVHMDTGGVRMWPRMTHDQLVRVFPDQRTVYLPTDNRPLAGYDLALADIKARGGSTSDINAADGESGGFNPIKKILRLARGGKSDDEEADGAGGAPQPAPETLPARAKAAMASAVDRAESKLADGKTKLSAAASRAEQKLAAQKAKLAAAAARAEEKLAAQKAKLAAVAARAEEKLAAEKAKLGKLASKARMIARGEAAPSNSTPNQVIADRGVWHGAPDGTANPAQAGDQGASNAIAAVARPARTNVASADDSGSTGTLTAAPANRPSPSRALAFAPEPSAADQTAAAAGTVAPRPETSSSVVLQSGENETTVAVKRITGRAASTILTVTTQKVSPAPGDPARIADPWLRALAVTPSVSRAIRVSMLGPRDVHLLADLMVKPARAVMMSFAAEPSPPLNYDHFTGSAVVFVPSVSYTLRTAQLQ
jgi:uncharacterized protein YcbK (DUF882 family)